MENIIKKKLQFVVHSIIKKNSNNRLNLLLKEIRKRIIFNGDWQIYICDKIKEWTTQSVNLCIEWFKDCNPVL